MLYEVITDCVKWTDIEVTQFDSMLETDMDNRTRYIDFNEPSSSAPWLE